MKTTKLVAAALLGAASTLVAGPMSSGKDGKVAIQPPVATGCECFNGGWAFSGYGLFLTPDSEVEDDTFGGGIAAEYFFNQYVGVSALAQWADPSDSLVHNYAADLVLRYPVTTYCFAPYIFAGGGVHTNGETEIIGRAGAGVDIRILNCNGLFADWTYTFPGGGGGDDDIEDYQLVRLGVKVAF